MLLLPLLLITKSHRRPALLVSAFIAVVALYPSHSAAASNTEVRNPFLRKAPGAEPTTQTAALADTSAVVTGGTPQDTGIPLLPAIDPNERDPLLRVSLGDIYVIGTITSPHLNIAYLRTRDGYKAPIHTGDNAGIEGFSVSMIDADGISMRKGEKIIRIPVHNPVAEDMYVNESQ